LHNCVGNSTIELYHCILSGNRGPGVILHGQSTIKTINCDIRGNLGGSIEDRRKKRDHNQKETNNCKLFHRT
jgi:hypothetical protein